MGPNDVNLKIKASDHTGTAFAAVSARLAKLREHLFSTKTAIGAVVGAAGFGLLIHRQMESIDSTAKLSDQLHLSTQALTGYQYALSLTTDGSVNLNKAILQMQKSISNANDGLSTYVRDYKALGLDTEKLQHMAPEKQMDAIADAMAKVKDNTHLTAISMDLFGARNAQLVNTLKEGSAGLARERKEAEALGLAFNRVDAAKVESANDSMTRIKGVLSGIGNTIAIKVAPYLNAIADMITKAAIRTHGFRDQITSALHFIAKAVDFVADAFWGWENIWALLKVAFWEVVDFIRQGAVKIDTVIVDLLNKLPGMHATYSEHLRSIAAESAKSLAKAKSDLDAVMSEGPPSAKIDAWFKSVEQKYDAHAKRIAATKNRELIGENKHQSLMKALGEKGALDRLGLTQASALKEAFIKAKQSVIDAYQWGASWGGPPAGVAMAGLATAWQAEQLAALGGISIGGSGGGGGGSVTPSTPPSVAGSDSATTSPAAQTDHHITIHGIPSGSVLMHLTADDWREMTRRILLDAGVKASFAP